MSLSAAVDHRCSRAIAAAMLLVAGGARADDVEAWSLPAERGVEIEAHAVLEGSPERVAAIAADPASFIEMFPAEKVEVVGASAAGKRVAVRMRQPWVGLVSWVETVARSVRDGAQIVERTSVQSDFYCWMRATWFIAPLPGDASRSKVVYRVSLDLRHIPAWMVRRGAVAGVSATVGRLRAMVLRNR